MDKRQTGTNQADSAPGVGDGYANDRAGVHNPGPGRRRVWIGVAAALALLGVIFVANSNNRDERGAPAEAAADINPAAPG